MQPRWERIKWPVQNRRFEWRGSRKRKRGCHGQSVNYSHVPLHGKVGTKGQGNCLLEEVQITSDMLGTGGIVSEVGSMLVSKSLK